MKRSGSRGQVSLIVVVIAGTLVLATAAGLMLRGGSDSGAGAGQADLFSVRRGSFDITLPCSGELAAFKQIEVRNSLESRAVISEIVAEGISVKAGDVLFKLNDEDIRNRLKDANDQVNLADNNVKAALANLAIKKSTRDSDVEKATVQITLAQLALQAWQEGDDVSKRKELDLAIETAKKERDRLKKRFEDSGKLVKQNFISDDEYKRDEIALMQAEAKVEQAELDQLVYKQYQSVENRKRKESDVAQALAEHGRVVQRSDAAVESADSDLQSKQNQLESAKQKLADLAQQLSYCTVVAPSDGLVVYFASTQTGGMGRSEGRPPQVGTELTRNEMVIILPDTSQMVASVKISEALVGQIIPGQRTNVVCDAMPNQPLPGEVFSVGVLAESGGWRDPNRRDYTVKIRIDDGNALGLKPSMRCKASVFICRVADALHIPVQAVFRAGPVAYVYVPEGSGFAQRKVSVGRSSELFIEVLNGLNEGDVVLLLQPQPSEIVSRLDLPNDNPASAGEPSRDQKLKPGMSAAAPGNDAPSGAANSGSDQPGRRSNRGGPRRSVGGAPESPPVAGADASAHGQSPTPPPPSSHSNDATRTQKPREDQPAAGKPAAQAAP